MFRKISIILIGIGVFLSCQHLVDSSCLVEESFYERYGVSPEGLILWLEQSDIRSYGDASIWCDMSGKGNNGYQGTATNQPTITDSIGLAGYGRDFDGGDDFIDCGDDSSLNFIHTQDYTWEGWFNAKSFNRAILSNREVDDGFAHLRIYVVGSSQKLRLFSFYDSVSVTSNKVLSTNQWYHFAVVYSNRSVSFYIDGLSAGTGYEDFYTDGVGLEIGAASDPSVHKYFNGTIDEVRIYNRVLSAGEINKIYLVGKQKHEGL